MTDSSPITPPLELVYQWASEFYGTTIAPGEASIAIANQAARWGADQELKACVEWLNFYSAVSEASDLRIARRPKPPSLKEQALQLVEVFTTPSGRCGAKLTAEQCDTIRRALEALPDV